MQNLDEQKNSILSIKYDQNVCKLPPTIEWDVKTPIYKG